MVHKIWHFIVQLCTAKCDCSNFTDIFPRRETPATDWSIIWKDEVELSQRIVSLTQLQEWDDGYKLAMWERSLPWMIDNTTILCVFWRQSVAMVVLLPQSSIMGWLSSEWHPHDCVVVVLSMVILFCHGHQKLANHPTLLNKISNNSPSWLKIFNNFHDYSFNYG